MTNMIVSSPYLDVGVQGIVDQVVGPKIQQIQPDVENILYKMFGVEKPDSNDEEEEMMEDDTVKSEKLSNISSGESPVLLNIFEFTTLVDFIFIPQARP